MSARLQEAREAMDAARRGRAVAALREPDLFAPSWERPTSPPDQWVDACLGIIEELARTRYAFTIEDVRPHVPPTVDYRALGSVIRQAARRGWIEAGSWTAGDKLRHSRPIRVWKSRLTKNTGPVSGTGVIGAAMRDG